MTRKIQVLSFVVVFVIKLLTILYLGHLTKSTNPEVRTGWFATLANDTRSYIEPTENWLQKGEYFLLNEKGEKVYAGRTPYYSIYYLFFRSVTNQVVAYDCLVLLQVLLESVTIVLACIIVFSITGSMLGYYLAMVLFLISLNVTYWTSYIMPESLGLSFLMLFSYFYFRWGRERKTFHLVLSSIFLALLVVMKSYYIFMYLLIFLDWLLTPGMNVKDKLRMSARNTILFAGILIGILSPWIIRNFKVYDKFVPTQIDMYAGIPYTKSELACREYITAFGGSIIFWDPASVGCYFMPRAGFACSYVLTDEVVPKGYSIDDIVRLRNRFVEVSENFDAEKDSVIAAEFLALVDAFKKHDPLSYYFTSRLKIMSRFIFQSGSYYLPLNVPNSFFTYYMQLPVKLLQSFMYYLTLIFGIIGLIVNWKKSTILRLFSLIIAFLLILFSFIVKAPEFRYLVYSYPLLIIGLSVLAIKIHNRYIAKKNINDVSIN